MIQQVWLRIREEEKAYQKLDSDKIFLQILYKTGYNKKTVQDWVEKCQESVNEDKTENGTLRYLTQLSRLGLAHLPSQPDHTFLEEDSLHVCVFTI